MSSGMNTANGSSGSESMTGGSAKHQSSAISKHSPISTRADIKDWLMSLPPVSRANHSPLPANREGPTTHATCGPPLFELYKKSDQDLFSWRMCQGLFQVDISEQSSETWPKAFMMREGVVYPLPSLGPIISETGSGSGLYERGMWPTPKAWDAEMGTPRTSGRPIKRVTHLGTAARYWPTPQSRDGDQRGAQGKRYHNPERSNDLPDATAASGYTGPLNPEFVEWLMWWPRGWTSLEPMNPQHIQDWHDGPNVPEWNGVPRVAKGIKDRVSRLKAIGNGQAGLCPSTAIRFLTNIIDDNTEIRYDYTNPRHPPNHQI